MTRKFAIPTLDGKSCAHFGHCQSFAVVEVEDDKMGIVEFLEPPVHKPGSYPRFLADEGVHIVIAGGMGAKAQALFQKNNIAVHMGVGVEDPGALVAQFLKNELQTGTNLCNHGSDDHHRCGH